MSYEGDTIQATRVGTGVVSNTEYGYLDGVTSSIQTQINAIGGADPELTAIAGLTSAADKLPYYTGSGTAALADFTAAGRALVDDASAAAQRTTLGLGTLATQSGTFSGTSSGTNTGDQTITLTGAVTGSGTGSFATSYGDVEISSIAGLTSAADRLPYYTGSGTAALATFTSAGRDLVDDANAAAQRVTLSLGNVENTALSTWAGSTNITTLGTITTGTWNATAIAAAKIGAHASTHNAGGSDVLAIDAAAGTGSLRTLGTASTAACAGNDARLLGLVDLYTRWVGMQGPLGSGTILLVSDTAYFVYLGRVATTYTPAYVKAFCGTVAAGTQTAEIGLFSSSSGPNAANQSLTKIEATGTITALSGTGVKQNTSAFTTSVPAGTHLWGGIRTAMSITQPTCNALNRDYARGTLLTTATAGALTNAGPWTGVVVAATAATAEAPVLWTSQDA